MASLRLGDTTPDFTQASSEGEIHFHRGLGNSSVTLYLRLTPQSNT